ncbi:MAG: hypothetical protein UT08_C0018G0022 [Candidatus Woesebacteria bacterium GW2011_GWB1_38_8]|uniref:Uncharacterized protein n=1 Tax=Candidatus Woesebacteria bacterium GW2011_GWB1_38_8 TaxID=1618570 RepID=A0A0G0P519_9BACT|nr:MAG: hypothetical protein UT08_C0018G0022 [Candidatus Woesebacteria bacterium GW2011_GWB1_38_8]
MDKNQRGEVRYRLVSGFAQLIIILTGALVVLMTIGFFAFKNGQIKLNSLTNKSAPSPTPTAVLEETTNWKTYTNTSISFKYPNTWPEPKEYQLSTKFKIEFEDDSNTKNIKMTITDGVYYDQILQKELTFKQYLEMVEPSQYANSVSKDTVVYGNLSGYRYTYYPDFYVTEIFLSTSDTSTQIISVTYRHDDSESNTDMPKILDQILSTFEFIDEETGFVCPESKIIDCGPCMEEPCPYFEPQYCSKGSAQYNWILENCPGVEIKGLD